MAINKKILKRIEDKTKSDLAMRQNINMVLSGIESGRQGKRLIDSVMKSI